MAGMKADAESFVKRWRGKGNENQDAQLFWIDLLQDLPGAKDTIPLLKFETPVSTAVSDRGGYIDVLIPAARVMGLRRKSWTVSN